MEENTFWLRIWQTAAAALVGLVLTFAGCTSIQNATIERMVKQGTDPLRAACAVRGEGDRSGTCAVLAATK